MKNKLFMTFGGAVAAMCPWLADAETFPTTSGLMLENKTYESAATYDNMGVYDGTVTAAAEYADALYRVGAGQYLPAGSEGVGAACPTGYYCTGIYEFTYNESRDQGLEACPDGYANSDAGASNITQCYTACTDVSAFAHATAVAGNDYYGITGVECYATECVSGYHVTGDIEVVYSDPLIDVTLDSPKSICYINPNASKYNESAFGLTENGTWATEFSIGTVYGQASCQGESPNALAMAYYSGVIYNPIPYTADEVRSELLSRVDETKANAVSDVFAEYKAGTKTQEDVAKAGYAILGVEGNADFSKTDSGQYCYCQMTDFKPTDGVKGSVTSAPWVFGGNFDSADGCASNCAYNCADHMRYYSAPDIRAFRAAVYGSLGTRTVGVCVANEISITWDGADAADVAANNAGTTTYDGDIRTPVKAQSVPGKIFKGWKFNK